MKYLMLGLIAETGQVLGGYSLVETATIDEAVELARAWPWPGPGMDHHGGTAGHRPSPTATGRPLRRRSGNPSISRCARKPMLMSSRTASSAKTQYGPRQ